MISVSPCEHMCSSKAILTSIRAGMQVHVEVNHERWLSSIQAELQVCVKVNGSAGVISAPCRHAKAQNRCARSIDDINRFDMRSGARSDINEWSFAHVTSLK